MWQLPNWRPSDENVILRLPIFWLCFLDLFLRFSDEDASNKHECAAKAHLQSGGEHWRIHESVSHPCDDPEFGKDDDNCNPQGKLKLPD